MAFLQLKQKYNMSTESNDRSINVQLQVEPNDVEGVTNKYNKFEFMLPCKNIGSDYVTAETGSYTIYNEMVFDLKCTQHLMKKMVRFSKGDCVNIKMYNDGDKTDYIVNPSKVDYDKPVEETSTVKETKYGYGSVKERDTDRRLDILWGMAFNNATRLAASEKLHAEANIKEKVELIKMIMPEMFNIAKGLDDVLMQEQKQEDNDDDLPF